MKGCDGLSVTKKDLAVRAAKIMRDAGYRKTIDIPKHRFTISDEEGDKHDFIVGGQSKRVSLDEKDTTAVIEAIRECIWETLSKGDKVRVQGVGTLGLKHRKGGRTKQFDTGEWIDIADRYVPNFVPSEKLKIIARVNGPLVNTSDKDDDDADITVDETTEAE